MESDLLYQNIGNLIRARRKQLRMTQEKLATLIGTSRASLANIETGRQRVLIHQLYVLAEHLELKVADLLPEITTKPAPSVDFRFPEGLNQDQEEQLARLLISAKSDAEALSAKGEQT